VKRAKRIFSGAIDGYDFKAQKVSVLGQTFVLSLSNSAKALVQRAYLAQDAVAILGAVSSNGRVIISGVARDNRQYVPGASKVAATGKVSAVDATIGTFRVNGLTVQSLVRGVRAGDTVAVVGTQPNRCGSLVAESVRVIRR
jgi:hypothetical protein